MSILSPFDFNDNNITFRFVDINILQTIDLCGEDFFLIPGFLKTDSVSRINVPRNSLKGLFAFNIKSYDLSNNDFTDMQYCMDEAIWTDLSYSESVVIKEKAINPSLKYQQLKYDLTRYFIKSITSSIYQNGLFRNKSEFLNKITELDASFNQSVSSIINLCGTKLIPKLATTYTNNPCRILLESILSQDNVLGTDNAKRRTAFIKYMNDDIFADITVCVRGKAVSDNTNTIKYNAPLKLIKTDTYTNEFKFNEIYNNDGDLLVDASYQVFYFSPSSPVVGTVDIITGNTFYHTIYNKFIPFNFDYGDAISLRLTYKPANNLFMGKTIQDRSYEIYVDAGLDTNTDISYNPLGSYSGNDAIVNAAVSPALFRTYEANGINTAFQYVFDNALADNPYKSSYNFYPTLFDISNITFSTSVTHRPNTSSGTITDASWNKTYNDPSNNWIVSVYARPRYTGPNKTNPGFDRFNSVTFVNTNNGTLSSTTQNFTIDMKWTYISNTYYTWTDLLNTKINSDSPYGTIEYIGDQQIMYIAILTNYANFKGKIFNVVLKFKDGRTINMV
jgi:hypothetical protein